MDSLVLKERITSQELFKNGLDDMPNVNRNKKQPTTKKEIYFKQSIEFMIKNYGMNESEAIKKTEKDWNRNNAN